MPVRVSHGHGAATEPAQTGRPAGEAFGNADSRDHGEGLLDNGYVRAWMYGDGGGRGHSRGEAGAPVRSGDGGNAHVGSVWPEYVQSEATPTSEAAKVILLSMMVSSSVVERPRALGYVAIDAVSAPLRRRRSSASLLTICFGRPAKALRPQAGDHLEIARAGKVRLTR